MFSLLKSAGSGNRQERKITSEGKRARYGRWRKKALVPDSPPQYLLPETNGQNCERAENGKGEREESLREIVCLCRRAELHWKQSLLLLQESPSVHASFKFHLRRRRPTGGGGDCGSRKFSMAKSSIIAVSSSISSFLSGANVAMSQKNVQLFAGRQYLPLNPPAGGTRIPPKEEERWPATHVSE